MVSFGIGYFLFIGFAFLFGAVIHVLLGVAIIKDSEATGHSEGRILGILAAVLGFVIPGAGMICAWVYLGTRHNRPLQGTCTTCRNVFQGSAAAAAARLRCPYCGSVIDYCPAADPAGAVQAAAKSRSFMKGAIIAYIVYYVLSIAGAVALILVFTPQLVQDLSAWANEYVRLL